MKRSPLHRITDAVFTLLFPPKCPFCGKLTKKRDSICPVCDQMLPRTAGKDVVRCDSGELRCAAPLWYTGIARQGLLRYKFHGAASHRALGELIARCAAEEFAGEFDIVTWVPISQERKQERGFDQSEMLARAACRWWDTKPVCLLMKIVNNPAQSGMGDPARRRANVLGVYRVLPGVVIEGQRVLLVDDICTSGATLRECVRVLRDAGAESVVCVTVARTAEH